MGAFSTWVNGLPVATPGGLAYNSIVIQDNAPRKTPSITLGTLPGLNVTTSRALTLTDSWAGVLTSTSSGNVVLTLPTQYTLGVTYDPDNPTHIIFAFRRGFTGSLFVTPNLYRGAVASSAAMVGLAVASTGDWVQRTDAGNQVYVLTGADKTNSAHWTAVSFATANRPRIFWGAVANSAAMVALSNALPGDWCTRTDDLAECYELQTAPYSTAGNWTNRVDAGAPTTPVITVNWNDKDPQYLPKGHSAVMLTMDGRDSWYA
jgi:hypothetical protein